MHLSSYRLAGLILFAAAVASASSANDVRASSLETFCSRLNKSCYSACYNRGIVDAPAVLCRKDHNDDFDFGCVCVDGKTLTTQALKDLTGLIAKETVTKIATARSTTFTSDAKTSVVTPIVTASFRTTQTKYTKTRRTTVSVFQPTSYKGGNVARRREVAAAAPLSTFCTAYTLACKAQCKQAKSTVRTNSCIKNSSGEKNDEFSLKCVCDNKRVKTLAALGDVGDKDVKPIGTSTSIIRQTTTKVRTLYDTTTTTFAYPSVKTVRKTFTKTTVAVATHIVKIDAPGRLRIDRLDRGLKDDTLGYISTIISTIDDRAYAQLDPNANLAAHVKLKIASANRSNTYAVEWLRKGKSPLYLTQPIFPNDPEYSTPTELGDPGDCDHLVVSSWNETLYPFTSADFYEGRPLDDPVLQSYSFILGASSRNRVNPSRRTQRELIPIYYNSYSYISQPYPAYDSYRNVLFLASYEQANTTCKNAGGQGDPIPPGRFDVKIMYEPDEV